MNPYYLTVSLPVLCYFIYLSKLYHSCFKSTICGVDLNNDDYVTSIKKTLVCTWGETKKTYLLRKVWQLYIDQSHIHSIKLIVYDTFYLIYLFCDILTGNFRIGQIILQKNTIQEYQQQNKYQQRNTKTINCLVKCQILLYDTCYVHFTIILLLYIL